MTDRYPEDSDLLALRRNPDWPLTSEALACDGHPPLCDDQGCERDRGGEPCPWRDGWDRNACVAFRRETRPADAALVEDLPGLSTALLRDIESALRAEGSDTPSERLDRVADVLTRYAVLGGAGRDAAHAARLIATDLRQLAADMETP